jgi:hypothetical protein
MTLFANPIHKFLKAHILALNNPLTQVVISNDGNDGNFFLMNSRCPQFATFDRNFFFPKKKQSI